MGKRLEGYFQKDVQALAGRISIDGEPCAPRDANLVAECLCLRVPLIVDLFDDERAALGFRRALLSLKTIDAKSYFKDVKAIYSALTSEEFLNDGNWACFKHMLAPLPSWLVTPLRNHLPDGEVTAAAFAAVLQWARFDSHMSFRGTAPTEELIAYCDDEFSFHDMPVDEELCSSLNDIIKEWCESFPNEATPFTGCHSSGAVTNVPRKFANARRKTQSLVMDPASKEYVRYRTGWDEDPFTLLKVVDNQLFLVPFVPDAESCDPVHVIAVPKDPSKRRIVSPEGPMHMFLQADAANMVMPWLNSFHWCNLSDQSQSRDMCLRASEHASHVTVDQSKASDYVRHSLMRIILRDTPLWPLYDLTRSEEAEVSFSKKDNVKLHLEKASPMGSKMCFPDMTCVLASACELSVRIELGRKSRRGDFRVYGDDILIRRDCWYRLRLILSLLRFVVNNDKTFDGTGPLIFREACGMFALNGADVTPFQISRKYEGIVNTLNTTQYRKAIKMKIPDAARTLGLLDMLNRLTVRGLKCTRRSLYTMLSDEPWMERVWRIRLSDYLSDQSRIKQGKTPVFDCPTPTLITYDHVDANDRLPIDPAKVASQWLMCQRGYLTVAAGRPEESPMDSIDYFEWSSVRSKEQLRPYHTKPVRVYFSHGKCVIVSPADVDWMNPPSLDGLARLTYSSPGKLRWRIKR